MKKLDEVRRVKEGVEKDLLTLPGVIGVDIGKKIVGGDKTDELAIRVYVEEKRDVPPEDMIPAIIDGVKTDVIQRKFVLHKGEEKLETNEP